MSFPNRDLGPFEGENEAWSKHVTQSFIQGVTLPQLSAPGCDPAHAAVAHLYGAIVCAMMEGGGREDTMTSPELLQRFREAVAALENGECRAYAGDKIQPHLTVLPGGKEE